MIEKQDKVLVSGFSIAGGRNNLPPLDFLIGLNNQIVDALTRSSNKVGQQIRDYIHIHSLPFKFVYYV